MPHLWSGSRRPLFIKGDEDGVWFWVSRVTELTLEPGKVAAVLSTVIMGSAMARNLATARLRTTAWDRSPQAAAPLADAGALVAASAAEAVRDAGVAHPRRSSRWSER